MREILRGANFLGRQCKQGSVQYYGIEEQLEVVNASFKRLGITNQDSLLVHIGDPLAGDTLSDFRDILTGTKPALAVIDTLFDFLEVESENNYKEVKRELRKIRQIARETGTHILLVHHNSKGNKDDHRRGNRGILGSQAIAGGVDTIMVLEVEGNSRIMTTSGREIKRWVNRELVFDQKDCTYSLGPVSVEDEF
jgi:RecA-family ATPase